MQVVKFPNYNKLFWHRKILKKLVLLPHSVCILDISNPLDNKACFLLLILKSKNCFSKLLMQ